VAEKLFGCESNRGPEESNGSLPPGLWLSSIWVDCQETGISSKPDSCQWDHFTFK